MNNLATPDLYPFGIFMNLFSLTVTLVLLFILLFLITPQCTGLDLASGGRLSAGWAKGRTCSGLCS